MDKKPVILSGIQPSGHLCIANYMGAIKNWVSLQNDYDSIFLIVDLHSLSVKQTPSELRQRCLSFAAQYIACGIDPEKNSGVYNFKKGLGGVEIDYLGEYEWSNNELLKYLISLN